MLKINHISCYSSFGSIEVQCDSQKLSIEPSAEERQELLALALAIFQRHQAPLAAAIASAKPELLPAPGAIDAEWTDA